MFLNERLPSIVIRLLVGGKQYRVKRDIEIDHQGEVNLNQLALSIRSLHQIEPYSPLFYFDHALSLYRLVDMSAFICVHYTNLLCENSITFKCQPRLSDEILANPPGMDEEPRTKRSRERTIEEAFLMVEQWRSFYREGTLNEEGKKVRCNLDQSAELIGIPRKTLEDYFWVLRTGKTLEFDFRKNRRRKMGTLRSIIREKGKGKLPIQKQSDQEGFFKELRFELLGVKPEEEIFDILKSNRSHSSSDEDMIFQN